MTIAQYYNQARRQMEVPIVVSGGVTTENYISYCSLENTDLSVFDDVVVNLDQVKRYIPGTGWKTATYFDGVWMGFPDDVEPIEAGAGYMYNRKAVGGSTTWVYDCVFFPSTTRSQLCRPIGTKGVLRQ